MVVENTIFDYKNIVKSRYKQREGYIFVIAKGHPRENKDHYVFEHIIVMEQHIGRFLTKEEIVHHKNGIKNDNRIENLELLTRGQHTTHHNKGNSHRLGKHRDTSNWSCFNCGTKTVSMIKPNPPHSRTSRHRWEHVPWDKVNWYCHPCAMKLIYARNTP